MSDLHTTSSSLSSKEQLAQDLKTVDLMTRWRKKLAKGEHIKIKITEKGMVPSINIGDTAEIMPVHTTNLKSGNIVFYRQNEDFLVRRIVSIDYSGTGEFIVKGDHFNYEEPKVLANNVVGKVIAVERDGQRISLEKGLAAELKKLGSMQIGKSSSGEANEKQQEMLDRSKDMANSAANAAINGIEKAYSWIINFIDDLINKFILKKR